MTARVTSQFVFCILCALFVTALVVADIIGAKLFWLGPFDWAGLHIDPIVLSAGIIPFPLTFVLTDLINEFYGKKGARFVTFVGLGMAVFAYVLLYLARQVTATDNSPIPQETFELVFGLSNRMFIASLLAYLIGQLLDIQVFHVLRMITRQKMLWLRATGSTVVSQLIDSLVVTFIAFSGTLPVGEILQVGVNNYGIKFLVALGLTPFIYLGHFILHRYIKFHGETVAALHIADSDPQEPASV